MRVGLYFGDYSHMSGLWHAWIPLLAELKVDWSPLWDRSFLGEDLNALDAVVVPGGFGWSLDGDFGGEEGRERLRHSIKAGVSYVGVCYGADIVQLEH